MTSEKCVFKNSKNSMYLAIYVDDGVLVLGWKVMKKKLTI